MTRPKLPLPSLRFVILTRRSEVLYELIPHTDNKGRVKNGYWAMPGGGAPWETGNVIELCKMRGWRHRIDGEGHRRRGSE